VTRPHSGEEPPFDPPFTSVALQALGALEGQRVIDGTHAEALPEGSAWLRFVELASRHGWRSPACAAYVAELCKRAAG